MRHWLPLRNNSALPRPQIPGRASLSPMCPLRTEVLDFLLLFRRAPHRRFFRNVPSRSNPKRLASRVGMRVFANPFLTSSALSIGRGFSLKYRASTVPPFLLLPPSPHRCKFSALALSLRSAIPRIVPPPLSCACPNLFSHRFFFASEMDFRPPHEPSLP